MTQTDNGNGGDALGASLDITADADVIPGPETLAKMAAEKAEKEGKQ